MNARHDRRRGEKIGWIAGWTGSFLWAVLLAIIILAQGKLLPGLVGLGLGTAAAIAIPWAAPWRHPHTRQWRLMLPLYAILFSCAAWAIWAYGGFAESGLHWWNLSWILPLLTPLLILGHRRWSDHEPDRAGHEPYAR